SRRLDPSTGMSGKVVRAALRPPFLRQAGSSYSHFETIPPITPPTIGATQNSQSDPQASAPPKIAVAVERAGLTDAFDTGMATRWMTVRNSPIAIGAKPAGQFLVVT